MNISLEDILVAGHFAIHDPINGKLELARAMARMIHDDRTAREEFNKERLRLQDMSYPQGILSRCCAVAG